MSNTKNIRLLKQYLIEHNKSYFKNNRVAREHLNMSCGTLRNATNPLIKNKTLVKYGTAYGTNVYIVNRELLKGESK